jgi:hypothetical protein
MGIKLLPSVFFLTAFLVGSPGLSQDLVYQFQGDPNTDFGVSVATADDINQDGFPDILVGASRADGGRGSVYYYSGKTGAQLLVLSGEADGDDFGYSVSGLGDIDGDGFGNFLVGARRVGQLGRVYIYSGPVGALVAALDGETIGDSFGFWVDGAGDVDQDEYEDFIVGAPSFDHQGVGNSGRAYVYSGADLTPIHIFSGTGGSQRIGASVASAGDIDLDGHDDVIIGADGLGPGGFLYSGQSGSILYPIPGVHIYVGGAGDVNADGYPDFMAKTHSNFAFVYSGLDGSTIQSFSATHAVGGVGDVDNDGYDDVVGTSEPGATQVASGASGTFFPALPPATSLGGGRDFNRDGFNDVVIGRYESDTVWVYSMITAPQVTGIDIDRTRYTSTTPATITGSHFALGSNLEVLFNDVPSPSVSIVNDTTIVCEAPPNRPGPATVLVRNNLGEDSIASAFCYTPAILNVTEGDFHPGGYFVVRYLCDPGDTIFAIVGALPCVSISTPPFDGTLSLLPFNTLFLYQAWPFDQYPFDENIPDDPSLGGLQAGLQALIGPQLLGPGPDAAWTNCVTLSIH